MDKLGQENASAISQNLVILEREAIPLRGSLVAMNREAVSAILMRMSIQGALLDQWWDKQKSDIVDSLSRNLIDGLERGETFSQLIERVNTAMEISRNAARTLVQTAVTHVEAKTNLETYQNSGIATGYTLDVTFDFRTSPICRAWDATQVYRFDDLTAPRPPFHFNCRTKVRPVIDWESMGLEPMTDTRKGFVGAKRENAATPQGRATRTHGTVPAETSYEEWLRNQPKNLQIEVLGESRAKLFGTGKASLAQMIRSDGRLLSIDELKGQLKPRKRKK